MQGQNFVFIQICLIFRKQLLQEFVLLITLQEGKEKMVELLGYIIVNGKKEIQVFKILPFSC